MSDFLKSVQVTIDGPKLPFHLDYVLPETGIPDWYATDFKGTTHGPFKTTIECLKEVELLNKEFRDSGQSKGGKD